MKLIKSFKFSPVFLVFFLPVLSHAILPEPSKKATEAFLETLTGLSDERDYQIGSQWGKRPITVSGLERETPEFQRAAMATARLGGGTSFYLGKFNGHHMMATNYHVLPKADLCSSRVAMFPLLNKRFACEKFYGNWPSIDLALYSIRVDSPDDEAVLSQVARNFNYKVALYPGQELITIGFGIFRNSDRALVANDDSDCKVFSPKEDYRFIADPDRINPADYKAWSFATGCDVSHGDSGSAMVDRVTGDVVGIIWTTATNKDTRIQDSAFLDEVLTRQTPEVWTQLSYAVPAPKMREFLKDYLSRVHTTDPDLVPTLDAVISN